ncbi:MAG: NAD-dependent epimerase/dehydratase family protein [Eubacteriales bacterium]|nr:NAD-dependent epimerase/dehydratase family protein [Eubacteriales bacterium]
MKVLVTGAGGFIGRNLLLTLRHQHREIEPLPYDTDAAPGALARLAGDCDFVVHLAGVNRPRDASEYETGNLGFTEELCAALEKAGNRAPILRTSSTQAELDNPYGRSKRAAEARLREHGARTGAQALIYRLPNVFGKLCRPNYNSAVATFCHNIARDLAVTVTDPATELSLVYIDDVVAEIVHAMGGHPSPERAVAPVHRATLGRIVALLRGFRASRTTLELPDVGDPFTRKLHATYLSYLPAGARAYSLTAHRDARGSFTEFARTGERGQVSINVSKPGIVKGNHFHHTKHEKFLVVWGEGVIRLRQVDEDTVDEYHVRGDVPEVVDIPPGFTHNIENTGAGDMVTVMWASECFDPQNPDTCALEV